LETYIFLENGILETILRKMLSSDIRVFLFIPHIFFVTSKFF